MKHDVFFLGHELHNWPIFRGDELIASHRRLDCRWVQFFLVMLPQSSAVINMRELECL